LEYSPFFPAEEKLTMYPPSAQEFLQTLLEALDDLPADFARRFEEILKKEDVDRAQAIRQLFEDVAGE
jgi:predicted Zn-dependent protease with MMP-like domain